MLSGTAWKVWPLEQRGTNGLQERNEMKPEGTARNTAIEDNLQTTRTEHQQVSA